jgi:hypothetical protein
MPYDCARCGHEFIDKSDLKRHLSNENICPAILSDIAVKDIILENCKKEVKDNDKEKCEFCNKLFMSKKTLHNHQLKCKNLIPVTKVNDIDKMAKTIEVLQEQIRLLQIQTSTSTTIINTTGNTINNNTIIVNNNILLSYQRTDKSYLTDQEIYDCLISCMYAVPKLIEKIHFNPNIPKNHNVYISNIKNKFAFMYNGKEWLLKDRAETISGLIQFGERIMDQWLELEETQQMFPNVHKKMHEYNRCKNRGDTATRIERELELIMYNKRDMIIETRNNMKHG